MYAQKRQINSQGRGRQQGIPAGKLCQQIFRRWKTDKEIITEKKKML